MSKPTTVFPDLRWAQRSSATEPEKNKLWISVVVPELKEWDVDVTDTHFKFTGKDASRSYAVDFELYAEVDATLTRKVGTQQKIAIELRKKEARAEYWPRLTKDSKKRPFIRTDFDKWVDEDEQDEAPEEDDMFGGMGGMGGGAMGGAGGAGGMDFASMLGGGAGGMGGGAGGASPDMSRQMEELQKLMAQSGNGDGSESQSLKDLQSMLAGAGAGGAKDEDENDEATNGLGEAKD